MKPHIFLLTLLFGLLTATNVQAQTAKSPFPYRPWSEFQGDTLQYLIDNLSPRQGGSFFKGHSLKEAIDILEIPVLYVCYYKNHWGNMVATVELIFIDRKEFRRNQQQEISQLHCFAMIEGIPMQRMRDIFGAESGQIVPLTSELLQRLSQIKIDTSPMSPSFNILIP